MSENTVIAVSFAESSRAYQALSELKGAGLEGRVDVLAASIVTRDEQGRLYTPEGDDTAAGVATVGGSLVGLLIGVIGGPIGMLFGWTGGLLVGGAADLHRADDTDSVLGEISRYIPAGGTAIVAELGEYAPEVVDTLMAEQGGIVYRRSAEAIREELAAAQNAYRAAQKEAAQAARELRKVERHEKAAQQKAAIKEKLDIH